MQQPSVLIIDDSEIERYILSHQLKKIGVIEIMQKNDGISGLEFLQKFAELKTPFDLGLCQILMYSGSDDPQEKACVLQYDFVKGFLIKGESSTEELKIEIGIT